MFFCKVGCVKKKTSYTLSDLEHGKVYHFNLFAVNKRTNLSIPYGRTTLKYEPRSKPTGLRDGKISSVNLRKMDGRAAFKFKVMIIKNSRKFHSNRTLTLDTICLRHWKHQNCGNLCLGSGRSQRPRGLRRRSAAARLLALPGRIPQGSWVSVCCKWCISLGRGLCVGLITRPEESY